MTSFADLEAQLTIETIDRLATETISVMRNRVAGALDPDTRTRDGGAVTPAETAPAIASPRIATTDEQNRRVLMTYWDIAASGLTFTPSPTGRVEAGDGTEWSIRRVEPRLNNTTVRIHGIRPA